jgi:hypothetical protein
MIQKVIPLSLRGWLASFHGDGAELRGNAALPKSTDRVGP